jgi:hypothetical protein
VAKGAVLSAALFAGVLAAPALVLSFLRPTCACLHRDCRQCVVVSHGMEVSRRSIFCCQPVNWQQQFDWCHTCSQMACFMTGVRTMLIADPHTCDMPCSSRVSSFQLFQLFQITTLIWVFGTRSGHQAQVTVPVVANLLHCLVQIAVIGGTTGAFIVCLHCCKPDFGPGCCGPCLCGVSSLCGVACMLSVVVFDFVVCPLCSVLVWEQHCGACRWARRLGVNRGLRKALQPCKWYLFKWLLCVSRVFTCMAAP